MTFPAPQMLPARRRWTILAVCAFALFLVGLDTTIVTVGLAEISAGLDVPPQRMAWAVDAYTVPFASLLITSGAAADRFGRRRVFLIGLSVFGAASLACAVAPTLELLIGARAIQGVGASMLTPVALSIVVNAMPDPRERAQAIGVWGAMFGLSMAAGPVVGGALLSAFDWRALFSVNLPVVLLAILLITGVGALIEGPSLGWGAPPLVAAYAIVIVSGVLFIAVERRREEPLLEPALFRVPSFTAAVISAIAVFIAFSMTLLLTTLLLQRGEGLTPLAAGVRTLPMAIAATVCAPLSGWLVGRVGPRPPLIVAGLCLTAGGALLIPQGGALSFPLLAAAFLIIGMGVGFANAPITNTAVDGLSRERAGVASGVASTARQAGTAVGIAVAGSIAASAVPGVEFAEALLPGWIGIAGCGVVVFLGAFAAPRNTTQG